MSVLTNRRQAVPETALSVAGQEEPIVPAVNKNVTASPIAAHLDTPHEATEWNAPVVRRAPRTVGMRYLYARGMTRQPLQVVGHGPDVGVAVWSSEFQPNLEGPIHDAGFNDALYQAGYPGFNFGLSFKVQTLQTNATGGPGYNMRQVPRPQFKNKVLNVRRPRGGSLRRLTPESKG